MIRLIYFIPTYILFLIFRTVLILLGLVLIPPMALLNKYTTKVEVSKVNGRNIINWKSKLMYIWSNDEDGIYAGDEYLGYPMWFRIIYWAAVRNPANNLRFVPYISCKIDPTKVKYKVSGIKTFNGPEDSMSIYDYDQDDLRFTTLTWQGLYSNLRIQFKMFNKIWRFWIGWKIYPHDSLGLSPNDYRATGAGFATQFKRIYPRG